MMTKTEWGEVKKAWEHVKKEATINLEQAEFFLDVVDKHLNSMPDEEQAEYKEAE